MNDAFAHVIIEKTADIGVRPCVYEVMFQCPEAGGMDILSLVGQLEAALIDLNGTDIPRLCIACKATDVARVLVTGILEGRVLARLHAWPRQVSLQVDRAFNLLTMEEIFSAPTCISHVDETLSLSTAQRVEWLLRYHFHRDEYLQELLHAAEEAKVTADTSPGLEPCVGQGSDEGIAERIPEDADADAEE